MGELKFPLNDNRRKALLISFTLAAFISIFTITRVMNAAETAASLSANKTANRSTIVPSMNDTIQYSVVISNTGDETAGNVIVTDTLGADLTYVANSLQAEIVSGSGTAGEQSNVISWVGSLGTNGIVTLTFDVTVADSHPIGYALVNTAEVTGTGVLLSPQATTLVAEPILSYFPIVFKPFPKLTLSVSRPNSANQWAASWSTGGPNATSYELQESNDPNFGSLTPSSPGDVGLSTNHNFAHGISTNNAYYYRVRAVGDGIVGPWSDTQKAVGGYRDDFTSSSSGWAVRRTTHINDVNSWYEIEPGKNWLILQVNDSWDWGIASPGAEAPSPPYEIEYYMKAVHTGNLVSQGVVFGGDWPGEICPDKSTVAGWYEHELCFNHFYNTNTIYYGPLKMLFERVDQLIWCPSCGGSPMKRIGDSKEENDISNVDADDWNRWNIVVRANEIRLYANGHHFMTYNDTRYINDPFFGVFASTDEYSNSTARFEYFQVKPLDN